MPRDLLNVVLPPPKTKAAARAPVEKKSVMKAPVPSAKPTALAASPNSQLPVVKIESIASSRSVVDKAMALLAEEVGVSVSELADNEELANFGVDSLLSLTIAGKFREELDLDFDSSLFVECVTIKDLRVALGAGLPKEVSQQHVAKVPIVSVTTSTNLTPASSVSGDNVSSSSSVESVDDDDNAVAFELVRKTLAEEIGVSESDLTDDEELSELGLDSLMSLTVLGRLQEALEIELSSDFLLTRTTMGAIREYFLPAGKPSRK